MHWLPILTVAINVATTILIVKYVFMIRTYLEEIDKAKTYMESYRKELFGELDVLNLKLNNLQNKVLEVKNEVDFVNYEMKNKKGE
jgi:Tfp pilus assembly protein PilO